VECSIQKHSNQTTHNEWMVNMEHNETYQCMDPMCGAFIEWMNMVNIDGLTYCIDCAPNDDEMGND
jgi:hypothetical protein